MTTRRTLAALQIASEVRDLITGACPNPEDQEALWDVVKCRVNDEPFHVRDDSMHPSLTAAERNR